jgi:hypothetical protein
MSDGHFSTQRVNQITPVFPFRVLMSNGIAAPGTKVASLILIIYIHTGSQSPIAALFVLFLF